MMNSLVTNLDCGTQQKLNEVLRATSMQNALRDRARRSVGTSAAIEDLWRTSREAAQSARKAQQRKAAAALDATAEILERVEPEATIEVLEQAMRPLFEEVIAAIKRSSRRPNPWLMLVVGCLLAVALDILATQAGLLGH